MLALLGVYSPRDVPRRDPRGINFIGILSGASVKQICPGLA